MLPVTCCFCLKLKFRRCAGLFVLNPIDDRIVHQNQRPSPSRFAACAVSQRPAHHRTRQADPHYTHTCHDGTRSVAGSGCRRPGGCSIDRAAVPSTAAAEHGRWLPICAVSVVIWLGEAVWPAPGATHEVPRCRKREILAFPACQSAVQLALGSQRAAIVRDSPTRHKPHCSHVHVRLRSMTQITTAATYTAGCVWWLTQVSSFSGQ